MKKVNERKPAVDVEPLLGCGCFQGVVFLSIQFIGFVMVINILYMAFGKAMPSRWSCLDEVGGSVDDSFNATVNETLQCQVIESPSGCRNFTWTGEFYSIVTHWQLLCGRTKFVYLIMTLQMLGMLIGAPLFGHFSDTYGRKWTLFGSLVLLMGPALASAFSPNWQTFAAFRFIVGLGSGGAMVTNYVYSIEFLTKKHRLWVVNVVYGVLLTVTTLGRHVHATKKYLPHQGGWPMAYLLFGGMAYYFRDWRQLIIIGNAASLPSLAIVLWMGESPRWLLQKGRKEEAQKQLKRIARINCSVLDEESVAALTSSAFEEALIQDSQEPKGQQQTARLETSNKYRYWHLFYTRELSVYTVVLAVMFFSAGVISHGIVFNVDHLHGNLFTNFTIMGVVRLISTLCVVAADGLLKKFGRRLGLICSFAVVSGCALSVTLAYTFAPESPNLNTAIVIFSMVMCTSTPPIWMLSFLVNAELFPTPIRSMSQGFSSTSSRLGGVIMPQILYSAHFWKPAPYAAFGTMSLVACTLVVLFIPETKGKPLPDAMPKRVNPGDARGSLSLKERSDVAQNA